MIGYGDRARTQCEVVRLFRETHPDLPPLNQGTISKIEAQYREMGHVRKVPSKRQAAVDDDTKLNLLLALEENPITPARQLARDSRFDDFFWMARYNNTAVALRPVLESIINLRALMHDTSNLGVFSDIYAEKLLYPILYFPSGCGTDITI
ncbi:hypothetical protein NQ318_013878 [Aromia moschata]|uniref:DUF4817 domain-containing protein n=1 Tax=Aromia moschata TaxID=1265417 RepID=A0AAV8ZBR3_9CUCU|nr:hypothetical protein NQ318_013878 [Aromia moschata]